MSDVTIDIDRIVREVVRRLQEKQAFPVTSGAEQRQGQPASGRALRLNDRVVTMEQVAERLSDIQQLVIPRQAIVTPAVRDELSARKIVLVREEAASQKIVNVANRKQRLVVARDEPTDSSQDLPQLNSLEEMEQISAHDLTTLLQQIEDSFRRHEGIRSIGLFVTRRPHAVACEANRRPSLRAAAVCDPRQAIEARETLDANLFVVRPDTPFRLRALVQAAIGQEPTVQRNRH